MHLVQLHNLFGRVNNYAPSLILSCKGDLRLVIHSDYQ